MEEYAFNAAIIIFNENPFQEGATTYREGAVISSARDFIFMWWLEGERLPVELDLSEWTRALEYLELGNVDERMAWVVQDTSRMYESARGSRPHFRADISSLNTKQIAGLDVTFTRLWRGHVRRDLGYHSGAR